MIGKKDLMLDNCIEKCQSAEKTTPETERIAENGATLKAHLCTSPITRRGPAASQGPKADKKEPNARPAISEQLQ